MDFNQETEKLKADYLDEFEGVKLEILYAAKNDEDCDIGTTYMARSRMKRQDDLKVEYNVPITEDYYMFWNLLDGTNHRSMLDTGASNSVQEILFELSIIVLFSQMYFNRLEMVNTFVYYS